MSEISRIITNLGLAYGLGSKEQFIDAVSKYAQDREMNDEAIREIIEQVFEEVELTNRRRKAQQSYEAAEMENESAQVKEGRATSFKDNSKLDEVVDEMRALRRSIETLIDKIDTK